MLPPLTIHSTSPLPSPCIPIPMYSASPESVTSDKVIRAVPGSCNARTEQENRTEWSVTLHNSVMHSVTLILHPRCLSTSGKYFVPAILKSHRDEKYYWIRKIFRCVRYLPYTRGLSSSSRSQACHNHGRTATTLDHDSNAASRGRTRGPLLPFW